MALTLPIDAAANELVQRNPLALLVAMVLDQQVPLEKAFSSPYVLAQRLGHEPTAKELAEYDSDALTELFSRPPALHRFPKAMAARVQEATDQIVRKQLAVGLDVINDGEQGKVSYVTYALERLTGTFGEQTGLSVDFVAGLGADQLPPEVATALYRIVQEALTNVAKHADAHTVSILLTRKNGRVTLVIEDDGRGFDPARPADGFGLQGMRERVDLLGGALEVESRAGAGTTLAVEVAAS